MGVVNDSRVTFYDAAGMYVGVARLLGDVHFHFEKSLLQVGLEADVDEYQKVGGVRRRLRFTNAAFALCRS